MCCLFLESRWRVRLAEAAAEGGVAIVPCRVLKNVSERKSLRCVFTFGHLFAPCPFGSPSIKLTSRPSLLESEWPPRSVGSDGKLSFGRFGAHNVRSCKVLQHPSVDYYSFGVVSQLELQFCAGDSDFLIKELWKKEKQVTTVVVKNTKSLLCGPSHRESARY